MPIRLASPRRSVALLCSALACASSGCSDDCVGWAEAAVDPRLRRFEADVQIGTDAAIFSGFEEVARADATLRAIAVASAHATDVTVVGDAGTIRRSADGGRTWAAPSSPPVAEDLFGVRYACDDAPYRIAVGAAGRVLRSEAGEDVWSPGEAAPAVVLRDVAIVHPDAAIAVGDGGTIVRSVDRGLTWESVASGTREDLRSLALEDCASQRRTSHPVRGLAVGDRGTVLLTHDGGASWSPVLSEIAGDLSQVQIGASSVDPWQIHAVTLDAEHLWRWREGGELELVRAFDAPVHWFRGVSGGGWNVLGEGVLHTYRSDKQCAPD